MTLPAKLNNVAVVAVNVYRPGPPIFVGHINLTFYYYGVDQGTLGYNSTGVDIAGKHHAQSFPSPNMHGGIFAEPNAHALSHYVVVSDKNYHSMYAFALDQAKLTMRRNNIRYLLNGHNCADFAYQVFQHTDLTPEQKDVARYLATTKPLAAEYANERSDDYMVKNIHDPEKLMEFRLKRREQAMQRIGK